MQLDTKVTELSGIGKARAAALEKLGIFTLKDLINFYPRAYEYRGDVHNLGEYKLQSFQKDGGSGWDSQLFCGRFYLR